MKKTGGILGLYALLAFLVVPVYSHFLSPNELSRWLLAASLVEKGSLEVSGFAPLLGPGFEDLSVVSGRTYSNKAPGATLVALPGYLLARPFAGAPSASSIRPTVQAMRLFAATLPLLLLGLGVDRVARRLGTDEAARARLLFAILFATPLFAYGLLLFSHALAAAALFGAFGALFFSWPGDERRDDLIGGALLGLAVAAETTVAVPGLILVVAAAGRDPLRLVRIGLGGAPFALLVAGYNTACFGGPLTFSYQFEKNAAYNEIAASGFFGLRLPSPVGLAKLILDPGKGLLLFVPALALVPAGLARLRQRLEGRAFGALLLVPLSILLLFSGYPNFGGWTLGPRYLVAALPFLVLPLVAVGPGAGASVLLGASAAAVVMTSLPFPFVPDAFPLPWGTFSFGLLREGIGIPLIFGSSGGALGIWVPLGLVVAAAALAFPGRQLAWAMLGALFWWGAGVAYARVKPDLVLTVQRVYIEDVYLDRQGSLDRLLATFPPGISLPERLLARRERELLLPPRARGK
jgi:hypothetical protein